MWPLDRFNRVDVVRVGAHAVELWRGGAVTLERVAHELLPRRGSLYDAGALVEPLRAIAGRVTGSRAIAVLESAYAPVLLADTGGVLTRTAQIDALFRHRFGLAYGSPGNDSASWRLRWAHRYGDRYALGYGLGSEAEAALRESGLAFTAWVPALAWGLERFARRRRALRCPWWVWTEQDRSLAVHVKRGRIDVLGPVLHGADTALGVEQWGGAAAARAGLKGLGVASNAAASERIGLGCWQVTELLSGPSARTQAFVVAGSAPPTVASVGSAHALGGVAG